MADKHYVDEVGTLILVDCCCDITGAIETKLKVRKPGAIERVEWSAVISGTNYLSYTVIDGDFSVPGRYLLQASLVLAGWSGLGETVAFDIYKAFQ